METFVVFDPEPGVYLTRWQWFLLWLITRGRDIKALAIHHRNGETVLVWTRIDPNHHAFCRHLERCLHKSP